MKKIIIGLCLVIFSKFTNAQNGLENIIVEKYYVSNAADAIASIGTLPVGSVTYRVFADMLPGYKFQAIYGLEGHELRIETNTAFFNNEDRGKKIPSYTKVGASNNTVMLDTWLSIGAGCLGNHGVLKTEDNGVLTVVNVDNVLQNADLSAGIPLTVEDGLLSGTPEEEVTFVGFDPNFIPLQVFDSASNFGNLFSSFDASFASLNGSVGPTVSNRVLIAQFTTDGQLSFELNIQIGTPSGGTQNYVAKNPVGNEILIPSLTFSPVTLSMNALIEGFYIGGGLMTPCLNTIGSTSNPLAVDVLTISAMDALGAHGLIDVQTDTLYTDGSIQVTFGPAVVPGTAYYLKVNHRNSLETWSAAPVVLGASTTYLFSSSVTQALNSGQALSGDGFALVYSGDVNQDRTVDASDFLVMDPQIQGGFFGYFNGDLTGEGSVDASDFLKLDPNIQLGLASGTP